MVLDGLVTAFTGFFAFLQDIIFIVYALILAGLFFAIQIFFIWMYYKLGVLLKHGVIKLKDWFDLNKHVFTKLIER